MLRVALVGGSVAIGVWLVAAALDGLPRFMLGVLAVGFAAVTLALIVNQAIDRTTDYRHRRRLVHRFSPVVSLRNAGGGIHRCDLCRRIEVQASGVWLCPHCDSPDLS